MPYFCDKFNPNYKDMFIGFLLFLAIAGMAFWLLTFLISFLPYWIYAFCVESYKNRHLVEDND